MPSPLEIVFGAPLWVWPVLLLTIVFSLQAAKPHKTSARTAVFLPLFGVISGYGVSQLPLPSIAWTGFGVGYFCGAVAGYRLQKRWLLRKDGDEIHVSGEWFTLFVLMAIFWANFALGVITAVSPETVSNMRFVATYTTVAGAMSGTFLGRAIRVLCYSRASNS